MISRLREALWWLVGLEVVAAVGTCLALAFAGWSKWDVIVPGGVLVMIGLPPAFAAVIEMRSRATRGERDGGEIRVIDDLATARLAKESGGSPSSPSVGGVTRRTEHLVSIAVADPKMAIEIAYQLVLDEVRPRAIEAASQQWVNRKYVGHKIARETGDAVQLGQMAGNLGIITADAVRAIEGISVRRNLARRRLRRVSQQEAQEYLASVDAVLHAIGGRQPAQKDAGS